MKKSNILIYSLLTILITLIFCLFISFKAIDSSKAAVLGPSDSNLTYNEGQILTNSIVANTDGKQFLLQVLYGGGTSLDSTSNRYAFIYYSAGSMLNTTSSFPYLFKLSNCSYDGLETFTCLRYEYSLLTSSSGSGYNLGSSAPSVNVTIRRSDFIGDSTYGLTFDKLYNYSNNSSYYENVTFTSKGISFSDGFASGKLTGQTETYNNLYYNACISAGNSPSSCPTNHYTTTSPYLLPSVAKLFSDITNFFGISNSDIPIDLYNYLKGVNTTTYQSCVLVSDNCVYWSSNDITYQTLEDGVSALVTNTSLVDSLGEYNLGYDSGYDSGYNVGYNTGYQTSYDAGFLAGQQEQNVIGDAVLSIASVPLTILSSLFNFNILGFNVFGLIASLITLLLIIYVIKKVL